MWIKEPSDNFIESVSQSVNFLFQKNNIFIMDNHLAAGWCWMNYLDTSISYNLFHIDYHDDLLDDRAMLKTQIIDKKIDVTKLNFNEYCSLLNNTFDDFKLFRWDNYIINTHILLPDFFSKKYFATHVECRENREFVEIDVSFDELIDNLPYWVNKHDENKWIINIDVDYFFGEVDFNTIQVFSDEYIIEFAKAIRKCGSNTAIITLCLSPDCCGGWTNSIRVCQLICKVLDLEFPYEELESRIPNDEY